MHTHNRNELEEGRSYDARAITRSLRVPSRRELLEERRPHALQLLAAVYREGGHRRSLIVASVLFALWLVCASQL